MPRYSQPSARKRAGATYTPPLLATRLARAAWAAAPARDALSILDPAAGDGALLEAIVDEAPRPSHLHITAHETDSDARDALRRRLALRGPSAVVHATSFLEGTVQQADLIIANPPWVRTQVLGSTTAQALAKRFGLRGRVDLSHAFVLAIADALAPGGVAAVIVPNKVLMTRGAATLRRALLDRVDLLHITDLGDTRLFDAAVLPAILVFRAPDSSPPKGSTETTFCQIYTQPDPAPGPAVSMSEALDASGPVLLDDGRSFQVDHGTLRVSGPHHTWQRTSPAITRWLDTVNANTHVTLGGLGKIRVGIKSTADKVFVAPDWSALPDHARPELLRPLTTHRVARPFRGRPLAASDAVLYPHTVDDENNRQPVVLEDFPKSRAHLEAHRARLEGRRYLIDGGRRWFELWVPHHPAVWAAPKVVLRDIAPRCTAWLDCDGTVVQGDCYWLATDTLDHAFLALSVLNSTVADAWYDLTANNRLYAGRRRYLTQYLRELPLPDPEGAHGQALIDGARALYQALEHTPLDALAEQRAALDALAWRALGLEPGHIP